MGKSRRLPNDHTDGLYGFAAALLAESRRCEQRADVHQRRGEYNRETYERGQAMGIRSALHLFKATVLHDLESRND